MPESADWYNSGYIIAWGSNVPQTRTPDAHFFVEARYNGTKIVAITPDYSEVAKLSDLWLHPKQGTDAAFAMAIGHVILREFFLDRQVPYFQDYCRRFTDMPMLVRLKRVGDHWTPDRYVRQSDLVGAPKSDRATWKTVAVAEDDGKLVAPQGSVGYRWPAEGEPSGRWNLEPKDGETGAEVRLALSLIDRRDDVVSVAFPYFGGRPHEHFRANDQGGDVLVRNVPARRAALADGDAYVATVFDLICANYGLDRGLGGPCARSFDDDVAYTPAWQEPITGVAASKAIAVARGFADNAEKGRSMVIIGAGMNHWYHQDMGYRSIINVLMMCGTVGVSGGGWAHYVGQEKLRPQTGWTMLAFALDWARPPRQMNGASFFYAHSDQWRYEKLDVAELLSPLADPAPYRCSLIDLNVKAERMGWLPSAPQLSVNPLTLAAEADRAGATAKDHVVAGLKSGRIAMAGEDPDNPANFPRNLFIWRSNLFGSSGKGHEYFLRHFLGTRHGLQGKDLGEMGGRKPGDVAWRDPAPEGKLDLVTTLDFRMSTSCLYSDVVLPTATWYEKNDLNTSDMHPFIHPLSAAVDPVWESRSDWETYKAIAKRFSELAAGHLGVERDVVLTPIQHDTPAEIAQPFDVKDWKRGECDLVPGVTAPQIAVVERDYPNTYRRFTALGPLADTLGNGGKGITWNTEDEVKGLGDLNYRVGDGGPTNGRPRIETDIDAAEVILSLAPETNGEVAVKAWRALSHVTGRNHTHLAETREDEKIRFRDLMAQPRKIISSPTWSGIESEHVSYTAGYTNVNELIPWRTLTGRQQFYQDHRWFRDFGESFAVYRPPIDTRTIAGVLGEKSNGEREIVLNFITPQQKWGIHSTYTDNLLMLTLSRGGPIVWLSETDARKVGVADNDWIELFNLNGAIAARAVVSQRVQEGMCLMYHAREKIVNVPGSQVTGQRGGIHNSVTRTALKPTHMVWLRPAFLRLQLLRHRRIEPRRVRRRAQAQQGRMARSLQSGRPDRRGGGVMKVRAQVAMVLNLDKCIGCHTCSVTCKNVWTSRLGMEYAWFNNVETKPGVGYPKDWENQARWRGGWERKKNGRIAPKQGGRLAILAKIFANPHLPEIDDYYEPFTFDYEHLHTAPELPTAPVARPLSLVTGRPMDKIEWGPNWEELLGGEFDKRSKDYNFEAVQKDIYGQFENTFMMYLPRLCEHCLNPSCVASCPSGSIYKREEDGIVLIDQDKCRGWRMCVSGCPYKKIYHNWTSGKAEKCIFCYPRIEVGQPTVCSETCVGRIRYLGVLLYDADGIETAASVEDEQDLYAQLKLFLDPNDPGVAEKARADGLPDAWIEAAKCSPAYKMAVEWKIAFPLHPEYRTLTMVWYVPPLSPIQSHANAGAIETVGEIPDVRALRIPVRYLANLLTAGAEAPIVAALERMLAMRVYYRRRQLGEAGGEAALEQAGLTVAQVQEMHRYLSIANYEDRFVIPTSHREQAEDAYGLRGSCGFTFGNGCDFGPPRSTLFGGKMGRRKLTPVRPVDT